MRLSNEKLKETELKLKYEKIEDALSEIYS